MKRHAIVAAYCRVSTSSQSVAMQRVAIATAATQRGQKIGRWYHETTGGASSRPQLRLALDAARRGEIGSLWVYRLDRLSRSGIRDTLTIVEQLRKYGCDLCSVADGFDLCGPLQDVVLAVIAWAAQVERAAITERIRSARERIQRAGGQWGRARTAGDEEVAKIRAMRATGKTIREIAIARKIPKSTVQAVVSQKGAYALDPKQPRKTAKKQR